MDIERLKKRKAELGYTNKDIAELSGVPLGTVQKVFGTVTKTPRRDTYLALAAVLDPEYVYNVQSNANYVREIALAYDAVVKKKKQGEYTIEDYYALPDERRVELIDGVIYDMISPTGEHQIIAGEVYCQLMACAEEHGMECMPFISPIDVQLDRDKKTMVQPDVIIVCDLGLMTKRVVYGAPEFVMEVLSPSTKSKDILIKLRKYKEAGCREVWIVDPDKKTVTVYDFRDEDWPDIYTFDDSVPVAISEGKCSVDFRKVEKKIGWMFRKE
ncbi:MAG: Uma2 family endonuclease [Firmicutes bacterium]|nr:Uma2 family endonuclease [Bacillota bacterium]